MDGKGVKGENGGQNDSGVNLKKLDRICLYSRSEIEQFGENAVPLKTIHFNYNYNLVAGHPSHDSDSILK